MATLTTRIILYRCDWNSFPIISKIGLTLILTDISITESFQIDANLDIESKIVYIEIINWACVSVSVDTTNNLKYNCKLKVGMKIGDSNQKNWKLAST